MVTRNRIKILERTAALAWQQLLGKEMTTEEGARLTVIYPGRANGDNGPDFCDAVFVTNESDLVKGDVEVHVRSSDWYNHRHCDDPEYNNVILHVVMRHDYGPDTLRQDGKSVPVLCLSRTAQRQACLMSCHQLPCFQIAKRIGRQFLGNLLRTAGEERFRRKASLFRARLQHERGGEVLFQSTMRALGYSKNIVPFEELARRVPLNLIESIEPRESLVWKQAWLLGTAGLLPSQRSIGALSPAEEIQELEQTWWLVKKEVGTMNECDWNFSHVYPNNFPVRRIIAQSHLLQRYCKRGLLEGVSQLLEKTPPTAGCNTLQDGLTVTVNGYWQDHFDFGAAGKTRRSALMGRGKASEIIVNAILPFAFCWGEATGESRLEKKAVAIYLSYPKLAENEITRHMAKQLGFEGTTGFMACQQQGLIHIFSSYCREGRCAECMLIA